MPESKDDPYQKIIDADRDPARPKLASLLVPKNAWQFRVMRDGAGRYTWEIGCSGPDAARVDVLELQRTLAGMDAVLRELFDKETPDATQEERPG
jgi:hypothetical protein